MWMSSLAFVAPHRLGRLEVPEAAQAGALEDAADRSGRDPGGLGDVLAREALAAQRDHLIDERPGSSAVAGAAGVMSGRPIRRGLPS